jgi:hypothetical protein
VKFTVYVKANIDVENICNLVSFVQEEFRGEYLNKSLKVFLHILYCDTSVTYKGVHSGYRMWGSSELAMHFFFVRYYTSTGANGNENPAAGWWATSTKARFQMCP